MEFQISLANLPEITTEGSSLVAEFGERLSRGTVYILGPPDSGKTTLALHLVARLARQGIVAYLDADPGQSTIGLPSALALGLASEQNAQRLTRTALAFVGDVSPRGHLLQFLSALLLLQRRARKVGAKICVVDGCGYVFGQPAVELQVNLIHLLAPDWLIVLQKHQELEPILCNFTQHPGIHLRTLSPSPHVAVRSPQQRQAYRQQLLSAYFNTATLHRISWKSLGLHGMVPDLQNPLACQQRLIALCQADKLVEALGIVQRWHVESGEATILAPAFSAQKVTSIQFGSLRIPLEQLYSPTATAFPG